MNLTSLFNQLYDLYPSETLNHALSVTPDLNRLTIRLSLPDGTKDIHFQPFEHLTEAKLIRMLVEQCTPSHCPPSHSFKGIATGTHMNLSSLGDEITAHRDHLLLQQRYLTSLTALADLVQEYFHCKESFDDSEPDTYSHRNKSCEEGAIALLIANNIASPYPDPYSPTFTLDTTEVERKLNQVEDALKDHQRAYPTPEQQELIDQALACAIN